MRMNIFFMLIAEKANINNFLFKMIQYNWKSRF